jgi:CheY-like chemotaxis protein
MATFDDLLDRHRETSRLSGFQRLMRHRVREILLVSSPYDSFVLAEDGRLQEMILSEYLEHNLSYAPGITRVSTGREALELAREQHRFNLIISTLHIDDMHVAEFARKVREAGLSTPVVLLTYDNRELAALLRRPDWNVIDRIFNWQGDFRIFLTIVKHIEDKVNAAHDHRAVGVQVIILVEDSIRFYSSYLPMFYGELFAQSQRVISEGPSLSQKLLRMRARPKILLANDFEEAWEHYRTYGSDVLGIISDIRFPRQGALDDRAGLELARRVRAELPDLPVLLQSSNPDNEAAAHQLGAAFIWKLSPSLLHDLRRFMVEHFSFGDFVFRTPDGREAARARDLRSLEEVLETVPAESLLYHAAHDHFSNWLKARTEFLLAAKLKPHKVAEYESVDDLRRFLIDSLHEHRLGRYRGILVDFDPDDFETSTNIARIGTGSIGGKARGLAFVSMLLNRYGVRDLFDDVRIVVPGAVVLCTDLFDAFVESNGLRDCLDVEDDDEVRRRFLAAPFPADARGQIRSFLEGITYPLAVRSSSILEDSLYQPFAGVYDTYMLPNNAPSLDARLEQLVAAVKGVFASTYCRAAKDYVRATHHRLEEEKMAVIVQRVLGNAHGDRFYPHVAGVARSHNSYPVDPMRSEDGIVAVALGLGQAVVEGDATLTFCPRHPRKLPQANSPREFVDGSQRAFFALDLSPRDDLDTAFRRRFPLRRFALDVAEADGVLPAVASTYDPENDTLHDGLSRPGVRVVTFAPMLKLDTFPLAPITRLIMEMGRWGMNSPVEIEFAVDLEPSDGGPRRFGILQMRPLVLQHEMDDLRIEGIADADLVCRSPKVLGSGRIDDIRDVVLVDAERFDRSKSRDVAAEVAATNTRLEAEGRPYLLIGVGRWGSSDPWLGIPVQWGQISGVRAIVESGFKDFRVTPSQGSHFFQNLTSFMVGFFTVNPYVQEGFVDWDWLLSQRAAWTGEWVRHLRFDEPLVVKMNGRTNEGVIVKPGRGR